MGFSVQGLRVFLSILECGSLSAAGRELGMSQPAVSNHLHALEERFGVTLLARDRGLRPTPAGECLAEHAGRVLKEIAALEEEMIRHDRPRGRLAVGASTTPGEVLMPHVAVEFSERYPEVALDVHIADTEETVAALLGREVEVAVVGREVEGARIVSRVVGHDELVLIVAEGDPLAGAEVDSAEVADRRFVARERGSATRRVAEERLAGAGVSPRVAMELGSNAAVVGAVAEGAGVGIVPARILASRQQGVRELRVRGLAFPRPFVLLTERDRPLSPAAGAFVAACLEEREP